MKKAALLAAGESTRMMPLTANMPKHLLSVAGKPLVFHTLEALRDAGIKETLMIVGYRKEELKEGDLVFFKINSKSISHVGVYLGDDKFAHASSSKGVMISNLNEAYWKRYYYKGGRLIESLREKLEN